MFEDRPFDGEAPSALLYGREFPFAGRFRAGATGLVALLGVSALTEMVYHRQLDGAAGSTLNFLGLTLDDANTVHWLAAAAVALVGIAAFEWARRRFARRWHAVQEYIEVEMKKREAAA